MTAAVANEIAAACERLDDLRREVARVYVGSPRPVETMLLSLLARGHALLEGVPGVAKTTLVKAFATALGCTSRRIQFTPDLLPADITGTYVLSPRDGTFTLRAGPIFANVVLADEINRAPAKTQSALLEAMQERQVTIEGDRFELPSPFLVLATQNPIDLEGTYPLPGSADRSLPRARSDGLPDGARRGANAQDARGRSPVARPVLSPEDVVAAAGDRGASLRRGRPARLRRRHHRVHAKPRSGRARREPARDARPRPSSQGLRHDGGRPFVTPDDLRTVAPSVVAHRLVMTGEAEIDRKAQERVVEEALARSSYRRGLRAV